jgi:hypothetical protein
MKKKPKAHQDDKRHLLSLAKTLGVLSFTPLTMLQACAQAVDFKVGHHFGEGQAANTRLVLLSTPMWSKRPWTSDIGMIRTKTKGADSSFAGTWAAAVTTRANKTTKPIANNFFILLLD